MHCPQFAVQSPCDSMEPIVLCLARVKPRVTVSGSGPKVKASVVEMLHLCPVGDPILFLWLLRLKSQIELIALSLANFHPLVLWHYPVVDGSLEESKPEAPLVRAVGGPMGGLSSLQSASLSQRAGSSSQPSGLWLHTSPSCWPAGRSHTSIV